MRILHIISGLSIGGAEMMLYKLLSASDRNYFNPIVISLTDFGTLGENIKLLNVPVYKMDMSAGFLNPFKLWRFIKLIRKIKPDLIQGWMYYGNLAALLAKWFLPKDVSLSWNIRHTPGDLKKEKRLIRIIICLEARLSLFPGGIIYNSKVSAKKHRKLGYSDKHVNIIPNGFDCEQFKPLKTARLRLLNLLKIKEGVFLIGLIARYHEMKDHNTMLFSAGEVIKIYPKVHFVLVGSDIDKKNQKLVERIDNLKLNENVHLLGERRDVEEITAGLDIACSSSSWGEGFSNAIGEAMACGVPCVVTDVGDSAYIVGKTGLTVKPGNQTAFIEALEKMVIMSSAKRRELGKMARERIIEHFSLDRVVKNYEELYLKHLLDKENQSVM